MCCMQGLTKYLPGATPTCTHGKAHPGAHDYVEQKSIITLRTIVQTWAACMQEHKMWTRLSVKWLACRLQLQIRSCGSHQYY